ncbi:hypothetical protein Tco_0294004 [Tanacetum coccineum]
MPSRSRRIWGTCNENFIYDQEEGSHNSMIYMEKLLQMIHGILLRKVARRLKERIKENENKPRKIKKITKFPDTKVLKNSAKHDFLENLKKKTFPISTNLLCAMSKRARRTRGQASSSCEETMEEKVRKFGLFDNEDHQMNYNNLAGRSIHPGDVVDWEFLSNKGLAQSFFDSVNTDTFSRPQWGVTFRLGGVEREMSLLELGWRVGLYSERESRNRATLSGLRGAEWVNSTRLTHLFWPNIGDGGYNVGNTKAKSIKNPRIKLAHRCITMTISGRKETTNRGRSGIWVCELRMVAKDLLELPEELLRKMKVMVRKVIENREMRESGGFADFYQNMSTGDWQHMSTRDNLEPYLQIDPFPGFEADYPPYGYHGHMPPGYTYLPNPLQDGSS